MFSHSYMAHPGLKPADHRPVYYLLLHNGACNHEIKRRLHLRRKAMTNLDSLLKSRDITLPTKIHIVKATVFFQ